MPSARLLGVLITLAFLVAFLGVPLALWWEKRRPSSFMRRPRSVERVSDEVALDAAEMREQGRLRSQGEWRRWEPDVVADASEAAGSRAVEEAARVNALYHP